MGFVEWAAKMRKKTHAEKRRFVVLCTLFAVAATTVIWFIFFFTGASQMFEKSRERQEARNNLPMTLNEEKTTPLPFNF